MNATPSPASMLIRVVGVLSRTFLDFGINPSGSLQAKLIIAPFLLATISVSVIALIHLIRKTPFKTWFLLVTLAGVTGAVVAGSYLALGKVVASTRFMLPITISMHLAAANWLATTAFSNELSPLKHRIRQVTGVGLLSVGIVSCVLRMNTPVWWTQLPEINQHTPAIAKVINQQITIPDTDTLLVVDASTGILNLVTLQSLAHRIETISQPNLHVQVVDKTIPTNLGKNKNQQIFLYAPFTSEQQEVKTAMADKYGVKLQPIVQDAFWEISRPD